ncbi:MAG: hypothetical protein HC862_07620 [Scytonema sp. RU_4_4]|nr:hypothetical protein [Scytonema sp. RU_4_4]
MKSAVRYASGVCPLGNRVALPVCQACSSVNRLPQSGAWLGDIRAIALLLSNFFQLLLPFYRYALLYPASKLSSNPDTRRQ